MNPVQLGVIGCGVIGQHHLKAAFAAEHIELAAVADMNGQLAAAAAEQYQVPSFYEDGFKLIDDPRVEAIVLALPTCARKDLVLYAFKKGKHVLIEKPVAMNAEEVKLFIDAKGTLVAASCCSRFRLLESARHLNDFIASGELGELRSIRYRSIRPAGQKPENPPKWRLSKDLNGGGIMVNWGSYDLDYILGITGWALTPYEVTAQVWNVAADLKSYVAPESDAETHVVGFIRCKEGTVISFERAEIIASAPEDSWEIIGSNGTVRFRMNLLEGEEIVFYQADPPRGVTSKTLWKAGGNKELVHAGPVNDFAKVIREGGEPKTSLEHALLIQQVTDAIYASAEQGRAVYIEQAQETETIRR